MAGEKHRVNTNIGKQGENVQCTTTNITEEEVRIAISRKGNWKAPGIDRIQNFWAKHPCALHATISQCFNNNINNSTQKPKWLTQGITTLLPKFEIKENPKTTDLSPASQLSIRH